MRVKKIGAILAGAVMIGSAVAAAWSPADNTDFFVDPETGEPNAVVVVGANAAASDVTAAGWIAAQIGNMAHYEEVTKEAVTETWDSGPYYDDDQGDNLVTQDDNGSNNADVILVGNDDGDFTPYPPYDELSTLWWEDANLNDVLDNTEKREEIYVNLTHDWQFVKDSNGSVVQYIYPIVPAGPNYGFEYRVVLEHFPDPIIWFGGKFNWTPYYLYQEPNTIKFLCENYDLLGIGYDDDVGNYIYYGTPHWSETECRGDDEMIFDVGETKSFYGWEVTLDDINIYEGKAQWLIKGPEDEEPCEYLVQASQFRPDLTGTVPDLEFWPGNYQAPETGMPWVVYYELLITPVEAGGFGLTHQAAYNELKYVANNLPEHEAPFLWRCFAQNQNKPCEYDVIGITDDICDIEDVTVFALDTEKLFVGAAGHNKAEVRLYALEGYGIIHDAVCIQPCGPEGAQWALDVDPGNYDIEYGDDAGTGANGYLDPTGTPNYYSNQHNDDWPNNSGTEPIPDFRDGVTEAFIGLKLMNLIDVRVCGSARTIPLCCFDIPQCGVDDYYINTGDAPKYLELNIDDSGDLEHTDLVVEGGFSVTHYKGETVTTELKSVKIDPMSIVVNDDEVTETIKATNNLVLVGGPGLVVCVGAEPQVANTLTKDLVDQGKSTVDWEASPGEYEYIADAFVDGQDVVIIAGADRDATKAAAESLINDLTA